MKIKEVGYRPTGRLDTTNPPKGGSAILDAKHSDMTNAPYHVIPTEYYVALMQIKQDYELLMRKILRASEEAKMLIASPDLDKKTKGIYQEALLEDLIK